eukprot:3532595-Alexandrium_andersonii.AAC.1
MCGAPVARAQVVVQHQEAARGAHVGGGGRGRGLLAYAEAELGGQPPPHHRPGGHPDGAGGQGGWPAGEPLGRDPARWGCLA